MTRLGMLIDTQTCIGCLACTVACKVEHANPPSVWLAPVATREIGTYPEVRRVDVPLLCMHCEDAPCVAACPSSAIRRRPDGIVQIDAKLCCGTGACVLACPNGAISLPRGRRTYYAEATPFEKAKSGYFPPGTAQKCDLCAPRLDSGLLPACVEACPTGSRVFGDLDDPESAVSRRLAAEPAVALPGGAAALPSVRYTTRGLEAAGAGVDVLRLPFEAQHEWGVRHALEFFLLGAGAGLALALPFTGPAPGLDFLAALLVAVAGLVLLGSLGRPERFPRALANLRRSWISRGAVADFAFIALALLNAVQPGAVQAWLLALLALPVAAYPALAMRDTSVPEWRGLRLTALFLVEAVLSGAALLALDGPAAEAAVLLLAAALVRLPLAVREIRRLEPAPGAALAVLFVSVAALAAGAVVGTPWCLAGAAVLGLASSFAVRLTALRLGRRPVAA